MIRSIGLVSLLVLSLACVAAPARAQLSALRVARQLASPVFVTSPAGDARLFIVEREGKIRILDTESDTVLEQPFDPPFLDISGVGDVDIDGEGGLLGLAFAEDYATSGAFYVYYTRPKASAPAGFESIVSRFTVTGDPATSSDANEASETMLFRLDQPFTNHNGGTVAIRDGLLYLGLGDGGSGGDPNEVAQDDENLLGKLLVLDLSIANPDNDDWRILAKGLRNPFRFSFDRSTGDLYLGDVGQELVEEIDAVASAEVDAVLADVAPVLNFGWDVMEGDQCFENPDSGEPPCHDASFTDPIFTWTHPEDCGISIGGSVYRGTASPSLAGTYFFADGCTNRFFTLRWTAEDGFIESQEIAQPPADVGSIGAVTAIGEDAAGELYYVDRSGGEVFRLVPEPSAAALALAAVAALGALTRRTG